MPPACSRPANTRRHINCPRRGARRNVVARPPVDAGFMTEGRIRARRNPAFASTVRDAASPALYSRLRLDESQLVATFPNPTNKTERVFVCASPSTPTCRKAAEDAIETSCVQFGRYYHATQRHRRLRSRTAASAPWSAGRNDGAASSTARLTLSPPVSSFKPYV